MNKRQREKKSKKIRIKLGINPKTGLIDNSKWTNELNRYKGGGVWGFDWENKNSIFKFEPQKRRDELAIKSINEVINDL